MKVWWQSNPREKSKLLSYFKLCWDISTPSMQRNRRYFCGTGSQSKVLPRKMASAKWVSPKCTQSKDGMKMVAVKVYKWKTECLILYGSEVLFFFFPNEGSGWNFSYKYFCSSEGETLSNLAKDQKEGNNCDKIECEHSRFCQKRNPWGKRRMKVNSQSFYWISSSIVLHVEMNSCKAWNNFWSGIWIYFLSSTVYLTCSLAAPH